jgi:GAF domain-containing protein
MKCPRCQHDNRPAAKFCEACGTPFKLQNQGVPPEASYTDLQRALTEALEQQTATAEILRVISSSPTDIQAVLATVAERAARLCDSFDAAMFLVDGGTLRRVAHHGPIPPTGSTTPLVRGFVNGRVVLERREIHLADLQAEADEFPEGSAEAQRVGWRSTLAVPLMSENTVIGTIAIRRTEVRPFSTQQIDLLKTFANQAVIAIENVRLSNETKEALEQQTATSEILRVISQSPTDVQPVFDAIVQSATRLCDAAFGAAFRFDGQLQTFVAHHNAIPSELELLREYYPRPATRGAATGRAIVDRRIIHIFDTREDPEYTSPTRQALGWRTVLAVPMLRDGEPIGALGLWRREVRPFTDKQIALLQTFADQAVIAIENVRLFTETKEALEQQTATSEILRAISQSPTDVQPVFDTIAGRAAKLCEARHASVLRFDGELVHLVALHNMNPQGSDVLRNAFPMPLSGEAWGVRAIRTREIVHVPDVLEDRAFTDLPTEWAKGVRLVGARAGLAVPMVRQAQTVGAIVVLRPRPGRFADDQIALLKTFADQAVIAIENVRLFKELETRNSDLTEALDRQTATSEILRVISQSPTDIQPVFDAILANAARLCDAHRGALLLFKDSVFETGAELGTPVGLAEARKIPYRPEPNSHSLLSRIVVERRALFTPDLTAARSYEEREQRTVAAVELGDSRSMLAVPLLKETVLIGAITIHRPEPGPFSDEHIALLQTFADQAVIAIENVRLFKELESRNRDLTHALDRQTATSDVLRIIAQSPTELQPVLDAIAASAVRLCAASDAVIERLEGTRFYNAAHAGTQMKVLVGRPLPLTRRFPGGRAVLDGRPVIIDDIQVVAEREYPDTLELLKLTTIHSVAEIPLLSEGKPLGSLAVLRPEVRPFTDAEIALLQTFADQAVIAIENVRLFTELQEKNQALTQAHAQVSEALEQQTATAEILRVISQSQTELQPVFEAIIDHAMQLFKAWAASVLLVDGQLIRLIAMRGGLPGSEQQLREQSPWPMHTPSPVTFCIANRTVVHIPDIEADHTIDEGIRALGRTRGWRSILAAPIVREGQPIGAIAIQRAEAGAFSSAEIELLKTFTDQAAIAVENTRLLGELRARTSQLTRSVEELTALSEISRALSSTLDLDVVLQTIVTRASQLAATDACSVFEYDEATEAFHLRATHNLDEEVVTLARQTPTGKGEGVQGRMAVTRQPVQVPDISEEDAYRGPLRDVLLRTGTRAVLAIPMLRENELIGGLTVNKRTPGEFSPEVIELLQTFATQCALAIQNARLFREIEEKSRQLEVASQHKSEFLANMSHELRTPLNAIIGFSEVLGERMFGDLNEKQEEYLRDIYASGQHLLSLINDILDLSKIEAGRMELELTDFNLPATLDNALTLVRERAGRRGIAVALTVDERLEQIHADERKVRQVVLNLLANAIKFTPEGGRIEVRTIPVDGMVEISVSDTGVGIAPEDQEAIFEEFRQVGTAAKKVEGTGLGLALSRKFVELHGGRIWVKSQVGAGSTFTFTIPVGRGE